MSKYFTVILSMLLSISMIAQSSIDPKDIKQSASFRLSTDTEKALWNRAAGLLTSIPSGNIQQDDLHRFVTAEQITGWNRKNAPLATTIKASEIALDADKQFVSEAEKLRWNKNTRIKKSFNIGFIQVDDSTIAPIINIPEYNTYDRDRLPLPAAGEWIFIRNTDTKKINFRTSAIPWTALWSD